MKSNTLSDVTSELETLTAHVNDSIKGYQTAADNASGTQEAFRVMMQSRAIERRFHANALNERLKCIGQDEETSSSVKGAAHRTLISLKNLLSSGDNSEAITEECLRGEEKLLDYIDNTFESTAVLDGATFDAIDELKTHVKTCIDELKSIS